MLKPGLYEQILNIFLEENVKKLNFKILFEKLDSGDSHSFLAQYIHKVLLSALLKIENKPDKEKVFGQIDICNKIIELLCLNNISEKESKISTDASRLLAILNNEKKIERPDTPLSLGAILTGTRSDPSLVSQLRHEMLSAEKIDILCSFIKWSGIRILADEFIAFTSKPGSQLRIITTSYMGATDIKALKFLWALPNTIVKVSFDTHRTRLHAKSYIFHRETGFGSAYIGSANISNPALTDGLEWNVKISQYEQFYQWEKIIATFETYWNDKEFETCYDVDTERIAIALKGESGYKADNTNFIDFYFDLRPYAFQQEILDRIQVERELSMRNRHLIVAATGTGKTIIAAFDFSRWREEFKRDNVREPRILFVAHREEILKQSLITFRHVLRDYNFGEVLVNSLYPASHDQLFISIQSYNSRQFKDIYDPLYYDYVVIDEFHHAAANSYIELLEHIKPKSLIGLTATPERADGKNIMNYFDGHKSAEIRLPEAINQKLLCPFQYFCISDSEDYSKLRWQRGGYVFEDIDNLISSNDIRAELIIRQLRDKLLDVEMACGIGFCVSKKHAEFMAKKFNDTKIKSAFLTSDSTDEYRKTIKNKLVSREINFLFVVDLFNEGIDIPEIETVLFLRPTESLTIFLQQLGRGLRIAKGKNYLTVLDFVGQAHRNFRFDLRFSALIAENSHSVEKEIMEGLPHLPAGCTFQLEKKAKEYILDNIRQAYRNIGRNGLVNKIATFEAETGKSLNLVNFIEHYNIELEQIYKHSTWTTLKNTALGLSIDAEPDEERLKKSFRRILHIGDTEQIDFLLKILSEPEFIPDLSEDLTKKRMLMIHFSLWGKGVKSGPIDLLDSIKRLRQNRYHCLELIELLKFNRDSIDHVRQKLVLPFVCPLVLHSKYTRDELLAALGYWTDLVQPEMREGVKYIECINSDIFLVTLNKTEQHYSPTTMYEDYAISDTLFHWQSQSTTTINSSTGKRYIGHREAGGTVLLFVRENKTERDGVSAPYYFLGPADYVSHTGSAPISIIWQLRLPIPSKLLRKTARMAIA
ncbi:MAG: DUF3427 domain-containing protein [Candidatus Wallbacteria bacterium]